MSDQVCRVCGHPLDHHLLALRGGVAHTIITVGEHMQSCSAADSDISWHLGIRSRLVIIVRSLMARAGKLHDATWSAADIRAYSDGLARDIEIIDTIIRERFSWWRPR